MKKVGKRILSLLLIVLMISTILPSAAFAANNLGGVSIKNGTPSEYSFLRNNNEGSIKKDVGDTGFYQRLPRNTLIHEYCGSTLLELIPEYYAGVSYELSNPDVLSNCGFSVEYSKMSGYTTCPCLQFNYTAAKAGTAQVTLTFYYNYNYYGESGYCNCGGYVSLQPNITWYKETTTFTVTVEGTPETTYTVRYTDGVDGEEVFADQVTSDILSGTDTPAFNGTLTREGYVFYGWNPVVAEKVTADATYTATWEVDANGNGKADKDEDKYTVTYTDGVDDEEVFADQVTSDILSGTDTPAFNGNPAREGYVFYGWNPSVAEKVTDNATYTATWEVDANGDDIPDKYQAKVTFKVENGKWDDQTTEDKTVYVTLTDEKGEWSKDGQGNLTDDQIPAVGQYPNARYKAGSWDVEPSSQMPITEDCVFTYTYQNSAAPVIMYYPVLNLEEHQAYIMGYPDGGVHPNEKITRAEVATIFFRLLADESRNYFWTETNCFSDVTADKWYNNAISTLARAEIMSGYPDGTFRPNAAITRAEMAQVVSKFADLSKTTSSFMDIHNHWAESAIELAAGNGWIAGYPDGSFRPNQAITRAETVTMINRVLERVPADITRLFSNMVRFTDCTPDMWFYVAIQEAATSHTYERTSMKNSSDENWVDRIANRDWTLLER